jgi:hypothetical protein
MKVATLGLDSWRLASMVRHAARVHTFLASWGLGDWLLGIGRHLRAEYMALGVPGPLPPRLAALVKNAAEASHEETGNSDAPSKGRKAAVGDFENTAKAPRVVRLWRAVKRPWPQEPSRQQRRPTNHPGGARVIQGGLCCVGPVFILSGS